MNLFFNFLHDFKEIKVSHEQVDSWGLAIGFQPANVENFVDKELTFAVSNDCSHKIRARLSTVHLDAPGAFGGPEKFEKDSRWILRKVDRRGIYRAPKEAIYQLEAASKPGKFLHCTTTGRSTVLKPRNNLELGQSCWLVRDVDGMLQIRNLAKPNYCLVVNSHNQLRLARLDRNKNTQASTFNWQIYTM